MPAFRQLGRTLAAYSALVIFFIGGLYEASSQPFTVQGPGVNSNDFRVTVFAAGLTNPLAMARLADDSLLVTLSEAANFFTASGRLLRFTDTNLDGVADGPG